MLTHDGRHRSCPQRSGYEPTLRKSSRRPRSFARWGHPWDHCSRSRCLIIGHCNRAPPGRCASVTASRCDGATGLGSGQLRKSAAAGGANEKPRPGKTGALRTEGRVSGVWGMPSILSHHVDGGFALGASSFNRHGSPHSLSRETAATAKPCKKMESSLFDRRARRPT
jgi:hypothetical protein